LVVEKFNGGPELKRQSTPLCDNTPEQHSSKAVAVSNLPATRVKIYKKEWIPAWDNALAMRLLDHYQQYSCSNLAPYARCIHDFDPTIFHPTAAWQYWH
jgi:hypothetical protein